MSTTHFDQLLTYLKALADENRLKMVILLSQREYSVGELADTLKLAAPTASHHISKLRECGLVNLNASGNTHYYRFNAALFNGVRQNLMDERTLRTLHQQLFSPDTAELRREAAQQRAKADAWLDELDVDEFDRKVLRDYTEAARLTTIPTRYKKLMAVLRWLATKFAPGVKYTEREVNAVLKEIHPDFARLRRELIEAKFLEREGGGGMYWRAPDATSD